MSRDVLAELRTRIERLLEFLADSARRKRNGIECIELVGTPSVDRLDEYRKRVRKSAERILESGDHPALDELIKCKALRFDNVLNESYTTKMHVGRTDPPTEVFRAELIRVDALDDLKRALKRIAQDMPTPTRSTGTTFQEIRERVLRLCSDNGLAPAQSTRELERIGAGAARLYADHAHRSVAGFDPQWVKIQEPPFPDDESQLEKLNALCWTQIVGIVSKETRGLSLTPGAWDETERIEHEGVSVRVASYPPELWRERSEDYSAVLNELSRRAGEQSPEGLTEAVVEEPDTIHSEDYSSVTWYGTRYDFGKGQKAQAVRVLWEAWEQGGQSLSQETIRTCIGSEADRFELAKAFRMRNPKGGYEMHPAWGTMIQTNSKGCYRLVAPESA